MGKAAPFFAVLVLSTPTFAQHAGGFGGGLRGSMGPAFGHGSWGAMHPSIPSRAVVGNSFSAPVRGGVIIGAPFVPSAPPLPFSGIPPVGPIPPFTSNTISPGFSNIRFFGRGFGFRHGFGRGYLPFYGPLFPLFGNYGQAYPATLPSNIYIMTGPDAPPSVSPPEPHPKPAQSVIHEYKWPNEGPPLTGEAATFIIALKDGSRRSAVVTWVQNNHLYFVDSNGKQQVLASDVIDHDATQRLNRAKNLRIYLPS